MSRTINFDFLDPAEWTYPAGITVSGGQAKLTLTGTAGNIFNQPFTSGAGFVYNASLAEFVGGKVQQKDQRPANSIMAAKFTSNLNASWAADAFVDLTGNANGSPVLDTGKLSCPSGANGLYYQDQLIGNLAGDFVAKFKYTPNYTTGPPVNTNIFTLQNPAGSATDRMAIFNSPSGNNIRITAPGLSAASFNVWNPTAGQEYVFEIICINNQVSVYIDNVQLGTAKTITTPRTTTGTRAYLGAAPTIYNVGNGKFDEFIIYTTAAQSSSYSIPAAAYLTNKIELPDFVYSGPASIVSFDVFTITGANAPRFTINGQYWTGAAWAATSDTYATASSAADIAANIASLAASDTVSIDLYFTDQNSRGDVDDLDLEYTDQQYDQTDPIIKPKTGIDADEITAYLSTLSAAGGDAVKWILEIDGADMYYNGAAWAASSGYAQSNTLAEIQANLSSLDLTNGKEVIPGAYLHSNDGSTTPTISDITITYSFHGQEDTITRCQVWGHQEDNEQGIQDPIYVSLTNKVALYKNTKIVLWRKKITPTADGYFKISLPDTVNMDGDQTYTFNFSGKTDVVEVPAQSSSKYEDLTFTA